MVIHTSQLVVTSDIFCVGEICLSAVSYLFVGYGTVESNLAKPIRHT